MTLIEKLEHLKLVQANQKYIIRDLSETDDLTLKAYLTWALESTNKSIELLSVEIEKETRMNASNVTVLKEKTVCFDMVDVQGLLDQHTVNYLFKDNEPLNETELNQLREYHLGNVTEENEHLFQTIHVRRGTGPVYWYVLYSYLFMDRNLQYKNRKLNGGRIPSAYWVRRKIKHAFKELGLDDGQVQKHLQYDSRHLANQNKESD